MKTKGFVNNNFSWFESLICEIIVVKKYLQINTYLFECMFLKLSFDG